MTHEKRGAQKIKEEIRRLDSEIERPKFITQTTIINDIFVYGKNPGGKFDEM